MHKPPTLATVPPADPPCPSAPVHCDYCQRPAERVTGRELYPHRADLWTKHFYRCAPCRAHVGCHPGTARPLGRLAGPRLRRAKQRAHASFDPLWKSGQMSRNQAYKWLAEQLSIDGALSHIGMFDEVACHRVVEAVRRYQREVGS